MLSTITRASAPVRAARLAPALARSYGGEDSFEPRRPFGSRDSEPRRRWDGANSHRRVEGERRGGGMYRDGNMRNARTDGTRVVHLPVGFQEARLTTPPPTLLTLADLTVDEIETLTMNALSLKLTTKNLGPKSVRQSMVNRSTAMIFSKRSTRTRVATETATSGLGGVAMFLGRDDIQLGTNESLYDSAKVIGSMVDGIMARVAKHEEVETLAKHAGVPVINALSDLYHPTQILADILTLIEHYQPVALPSQITMDGSVKGGVGKKVREHIRKNVNVQKTLRGKKMAWVGDLNNITNELLVTLPRFGMTLAVAAPKGYDVLDPRVAKVLEEQGVMDKIVFTNDPAVAVKDADILVTDTWISMGQEEETAARLKAFEGYQITMDMANQHGAKPDWLFMHCLPRHKEEVDDEVFYSDRSVVFPEAENRKWTIMALLDSMVGGWTKARLETPQF